MIDTILKIIGSIPPILLFFGFFYTRIADRRNVLLNDLKILKELEKDSKEYSLVHERVKEKVKSIYNPDRKIRVWLLVFGVFFFALSTYLTLYFYRTNGSTFLVVLFALYISNAVMVIFAALFPKAAESIIP